MEHHPVTPADAELGSPRRQIYHQGILDGACFLYAIANAYKALTGHKVTREKWDRAMEQIPDTAMFLTGAGATPLDYEQAVALIRVMLSAFSESGEIFQIEQVSASAVVTDFCEAVTDSSVVVFAFGGETEFLTRRSHIVCGVAASSNPQVLHIACSDAFSGRHLLNGTYSERRDPLLGRYSNDSIHAASPVQIAPNWRWRITVRAPQTACV